MRELARGELDWQERAACRGMDYALFGALPRTRGLSVRERVETARGVCLRCPVRPDCRQFALSSKETGIWGGLVLDRGVEVAGFEEWRKTG